MTATSSVAPAVIDQREPSFAIYANPIPELTIVVPTLDERENIGPLVAKVETVLSETAWEVIFVDDDSRDGTSDVVRAIARRDPRVRCLQRIGRRGLSTACIEGVLACSSPYIAIMDADMQHDERLLPQMLEALKNGACDVAVGSRYVPGGGVGEWDAGRASISGFATRLSQAICRVAIADPMSGFFMVRRDVFEASMRRLSGQGFKILLDLMASSPRTLRVKELPFQFRARQHGSSKLDTLVVWEFVMLLADKVTGGKVTGSSALMALVIAFCSALHLGTRWMAALWGAGFFMSQAAAILVSAGVLFFLNQLFTHHDKRLSGARLASRLPVFFALTTAMAFVGLNGGFGVFWPWDGTWPVRIANALTYTGASYAFAWMLSRPRTWKRISGAKGVATSVRSGDRAA